MKTANSTLKTWLVALLPPILWAGLIFLFSAQSVLASLEVSALDFVFKKVAHMFVYGVLYLLLHRALLMLFPNRAWWFYLFIPLLVCLAYALTDEYHQSLVPGRHPSSRDIGYDMLGVVIAILARYGYI